MKKILYIASDILKTGGISRYNQSLINALSATGLYSLSIVSRNDRQSAYQAVPLYGAGKIRIIFLRKIIFLWAIVCKALFFKPDLVICGHINFAPCCLCLKRILKKEYAVIVYGVDIEKISSRAQEALKNAAAVVAISEYAGGMLLAQVPQVREKVFILHPAVEPAVFFPKQPDKELASRLGVEGSFLLLTVARLVASERYKGCDTVIQVLPELAKKIPAVKYLIVGEGDDQVRLADLAVRAGVRDKVVFAGCVPSGRLADYYNLCDVFIMPSKKEGFGIVFLEALACGKTVVAGRDDGSREALLDGALGVLVDPDDRQGLIDALARLASRPNVQTPADRQQLRAKLLAAYGPQAFQRNAAALMERV